MTSRKNHDRFAERLRMRGHGLSPRMRMVADFIAQNRGAVLSKSAVELAGEIGVSDATVIRAVQALGFDGLLDLKDMLNSSLGRGDATAAKLANTMGELQRDMDRSVSYVLDEHRQALDSLGLPQTRRAIGNAASILSSARRIGVFGIGASAILADYAARLMSRGGIPSYVLNRTGISLAEQLLDMSSGDALIVLIQQNIHREVHTTMQEAERLKVPVVVITGQRRHPLAKQAAQLIVLPRASTEGMPLHGPTLACLEMLMLGIAAHDPQRPVDTMDRLLTLRRSIRARK